MARSARPVFRLTVRPTLGWEDFPKRSPCCGDAIYPRPGQRLGMCGYCGGPVQPRRD
jgi:hypothetical protein